MKSLSAPNKSSSGLLTRTLLFAALTGMAACKSQATPTMFVPPTASRPLPTVFISTTPASTASTATVPPTLSVPPTLATPCSNNLSFVQDVTIPDGTGVTPGSAVDKQWLVTNSGTCNWNDTYRLKLIAGDAMGAATEQALYPARAGTQATLRIVLTAPQNSGTYESRWQAVAPGGTTFGDSIYVQISVSP